MKKLLAAFLCVIMVLALLPATAFAGRPGASSVWIWGVELTGETPYYRNGTGGAKGAYGDSDSYNAYFNMAAGTLTLKGLNVVDSTATMTDTKTFTYAIYANGDLTICVDGDNSISVPEVREIDADAYSLALYVTQKLTVQPVEGGSGSLKAESKGARIMNSNKDNREIAISSGVTCNRLEVKSGAEIVGEVSGISTASMVFNAGINLDAVTVTGGTLKGIASGTATCGSDDADYAKSCGIMVNNGSLSLSAGSIVATGGTATDPHGSITTNTGSYGVAMTNADDTISITGGSFTAKSINTFTAATTAAVQNPLTLGIGITADGSTSSNGSNPSVYLSTANSTYKWVQAEELPPFLSVKASPLGSVSIGTEVTLTATPINIEGTPSYQWYSNTTNSTEGAILISGATAATYEPLTDKAGTIYYYCVAEKETDSITISVTSNIVGVTVSQPSGDYTPSPVTVYNDPSVPDATVWLAGSDLDSSDLLVTERDPKGSAYKALTKLADSDDVLATYNIYLRSGKKSTGSAMNLTFDLNTRYASQDFTLVHQKADNTFEYFYDTADAKGDLTFGPLYELSPFMLVKGTLDPNALSVPNTGDTAQPSLWAGIVLISLLGLTAAAYIIKRKHT